MFGYKIVKEIDIEELERNAKSFEEQRNTAFEDCAKAKEELVKLAKRKDEEINMLTKRINELCYALTMKSEKMSGCKRGPQCVDCIHLRSVYVDDRRPIWTHINSYCAKCVHDLCPAFEKRK